MLNSNRQPKNIIILLVIAFLALLFWWIISHIEKVEQDPDPVPTIESRIQPYLALSEYLKLKGYQVKLNVSWAQLYDVDLEHTVVVIPFLPQHLPKPQQQSLDLLLDRGHVFVGLFKRHRTTFFDDADFEDSNSYQDFYFDSDFLDRFDRSLYQDEDDIFGISELVNRNIEFDLPNNWMLKRHLGDDEYEDASYSIISNDESKLVILPEFYIFDNKNIGNRDNALLFLSFLEYEDEDASHNNIWLVTAPISPGFFNLLWNYFKPFILALLVLITVVIWRASRRFGPSFPLYKTHRKDLKEHLTAVGRWHWYSSKSQKLININFHNIDRIMIYSYHNWNSFDKNQQIQLIAKHCGISAKKIDKTWRQRTVNTRLEFLHLIQQLQIIRTKL